MQPVFDRKHRTEQWTCGRCHRPYQSKPDAEQALCPTCNRARNAELFKNEAHYHVDTGIAACPNCATRNTAQTSFGAPPATLKVLFGLAAVVTVVGLILFWPVAIVGVLMAALAYHQKSQLDSITRNHCNVCGHQWSESGLLQ